MLAECGVSDEAPFFQTHSSPPADQPHNTSRTQHSDDRAIVKDVMECRTICNKSKMSIIIMVSKPNSNFKSINTWKCPRNINKIH